jgi:hypothetical protein
MTRHVMATAAPTPGATARTELGATARFTRRYRSGCTPIATTTATSPATHPSAG